LQTGAEAIFLLQGAALAPVHGGMTSIQTVVEMYTKGPRMATGNKSVTADLPREYRIAVWTGHKQRLIKDNDLN